MNTFLDKSGREVKVGDFIVYGHAIGRCAGLQFGRVLSIEGHAEPRGNYQRVVWKIGVRGVYQSHIGNSHRVMKPGTLQYPDRIILANDFMPADLKEMYGPLETEAGDRTRSSYT